MAKQVLVIDMVGKTIEHKGDTVLVTLTDIPPDKTVVFLSDGEYAKIVAVFDVRVQKED